MTDEKHPLTTKRGVGLLSLLLASDPKGTFSPSGFSFLSPVLAVSKFLCKRARCANSVTFGVNYQANNEEKQEQNNAKNPSANQVALFKMMNKFHPSES